MSDINVATSQANSAISAAKSRMGMTKMANAVKESDAAATDAKSDKNMERINKTAEDFEAVFITEMLKPMFNMIKVDPEFGGGKGEEVFRDFTLNEYGKQLASKGGFGIAPHIKAQLLRLQEETAAKTAGPSS